MTGAAFPRPSRTGTALADAARRYALAALGPFTIAAAHFAASVLFLKLAAPAAFGLFAFVLVVVPFWLGISMALLGAPLATTRREGAWRELPTLMKANLLFCAAACVAVAAILFASGAGVASAALFGVYGAIMCLRWFARWLFYATGRPLRAVLSDVVYGVLVVLGLGALALLHAMSLSAAAAMLCLGAAAGLAVFGTEFLRDQLHAARDASLAAYAPIWRDLTQWALLGVVTSELSVNAHAWLVTLFAGPKSFALIAAGSLFLRPVSLCLTALPDRERPLMVQKLNAGDMDGAERCLREFRGAAAAVWLLTVVLSAAALAWFPRVLLKADYDMGQVIIVVALWAGIMALRTWRTPDAVLLQAAREFKPLAGASVRSSLVSLSATGILLLLAGPVASLAGIALGDIVLNERVFALTRRWRQSTRLRDSAAASAAALAP